MFLATKRFSGLYRKFGEYRRSRGGNVVTLFALTLPVVLGATALGIDSAQIHLQHAKLQDAADAAALGSARELYVAKGDRSVVQAIAENYARVNLGQFADSAHIVATVIDDGGAINVKITDTARFYFASYFNTDVSEISAAATARIAGGGRICVIGLNEKGDGTVKLKEQATITAPTCAIYSNSGAKHGMDVADKSKITAELICSAGGVKGKSASFDPGATQDCPTAVDPLAGRAEISFSGCDHDKFEVAEGAHVIAKPGTYCNGLKVKKKATLVLSEGVYVFDGGEFKVEDDAVLKGEYAGLYFTNDATFSFAKKSTIDMNGPRSGPMAGLLMFEAPTTTKENKYKINSRDARNLTGTIYLPAGKLEIQGEVPNEGATQDPGMPSENAGPTEEYDVGRKSAYTAIVVKTLELHKGPNLVLNTDYDKTDVPVPDGIAPIGRNIWLQD